MPDVINVGKNAIDVRKSVTLLPYSKVIINVQQTDSDTVISYVAGNDSGTTLEFDCPWGTQEMANSLLDKMRGYQYQPYTVTDSTLNPVAELGDAVQTNGVYGGLYQRDTIFGHTMYSDYSAPEDEQLDHEFTFESEVERRLTRQESYSKANFQIQHDNIEARVTQKGGDIEDQSFAWRLLSNEFGLYSGQKKVFTCNKDGIIVDGEIRARTGYIGTDAQGFSITSKSIQNGMNAYNDTANNGVYIGTDGIGLGKANFFVTSSGSFTAKDGYIGDGTNGFTVKATKMYNGTSAMSGSGSTTEGVYLGTDGVRIYQNPTYNYTFGKSSNTFKLCAGKTGLNVNDDVSDAQNPKVANGVYVGTNGIALGRTSYTVSGKTTYYDAFSVNSSGHFIARTGTIGSDANGFTLNEKSISNGISTMSGVNDSSGGVYIGTDGVRIYQGERYNYTFGKSNNNFKLCAGKTGLDVQTDDKSTKIANGIYVGTNGIALGRKGYTKDNVTTYYDAFSVDNNGSLIARSGFIGKDADDGFTINEKSISNGTSAMSGNDGDKVGVYVGTDGLRIYQGATYNYTLGKSSNTFKLCAGKTGLNVQTDDKTTKIANGIYVGTNGIALGKKGYTKDNVTTYFDAFSVDSSGNLIARSGFIGKDADDGFTINEKSISNGTTAISGTGSTTQGVYVGTDGLRVYNDDKNNFTFNKNGTIEIKKGMTGINDTSNSSGFYFGNDGLVFGGGKLKLVKEGTLTAKDAILTGTVNAKTGRFGAKEKTDGTLEGGFVISGKDMTIDNKSVYGGYLYSGEHSTRDDYSHHGVYIGSDGISLGAKAGDINKPAFRVDWDGEAFLNKAHFYANCDFAGELKAATGTFSGTLSAAGGTFKGELSAATGTFKGDISAATGTFSGALSASSGTIGSFTISSRHLGDNTELEKSRVGIRTEATDGNIVIWAGNDYENDTFSPKFWVKNNGDVQATNGYFAGTIVTGVNSSIGGQYVGSGINGANLNDGSVGSAQIGTAPYGLNTGNINDGAITGGDGAGAKIASNTVTKGNTDHGNQVTHGQNAYETVSDLTGDTAKVNYIRAINSSVTNSYATNLDCTKCDIGTTHSGTDDTKIRGHAVTFQNISINGTTYHLLGYT